MWLEDIANYIRGLNISGIGQNVFIYTLKENDTGAMFTSHNTGALANNDIPKYYKGPLQLIVRAHDPQSAQTQAQAINNALSSQLDRINGASRILNLPTIQINYCLPRHYPVVYPRSDGDYYEASVNFDICFVDLSG